MLGIRGKLGNNNSSGMNSPSPNHRRSTGQPYLNLPPVASGTTIGPPKRKTSKSSVRDPVRKTSSGKLTPSQLPLNRNFLNDNYGKTKSSRVRATKSRESSSHASLSKTSSKRSVISSACESDVEEEGPNTARMSKDIAKAVAMIVAEYELLQQEEDGGAESEQEVDAIAQMEDGTIGSTLITKAITTTVAEIIDNPHDSTPIKKEKKEKVKRGKKRHRVGESGEVVIDLATTAYQANGNTPDGASLSGVEPQPGVESSRGAAGEQGQTQSSLLPEKVDEGKLDSTKKDSTVTIGLDLPALVKKPKLPPRCTAVPPTVSREARMGGQAEVTRYLTRVQQYVNALGYHREGEPETGINVRLSMKTHMLTAKHLIYAGRPIKCLHAVVLCVHMTNALDTVERFPIYFRSHVGAREYKHIVLGIYCQGHFGAMGISRDEGLQDKKLIYTKLSDLILEFAKSYENSGHILNEVKLGMIITHDQSSLEKLFSKIGSVAIHSFQKAEIEANVENIAKQLRARMGVACLKSQFFDNKHISPTPHMRRSRSRASLEIRLGSNNASNNTSKASSNTNNSNVVRPRAISLGPNLANNLRFKSDDKMTTINQKTSKTSTRTRTKLPKNKRK